MIELPEGITRRMFDGELFLVDENRNRSQVSYWGSEEAALNALESNTDCENCINCTGCTDCKNCVACDCSSRCISCVSCDGGYELTRCERVGYADGPGVTIESKYGVKDHEIPVFKGNLHAAIYKACTITGKLEMGHWHCDASLGPRMWEDCSDYYIAEKHPDYTTEADRVSHKERVFQCIKAHDSDVVGFEKCEPGVGSDWKTYWAEIELKSMEGYCGTSHCRAGWINALCDSNKIKFDDEHAGEYLVEYEKRLHSTSYAALSMFKKSTGIDLNPCLFSGEQDNNEVLAVLKLWAERAPKPTPVPA